MSVSYSPNSGIHLQSSGLSLKIIKKIMEKARLASVRLADCFRDTRTTKGLHFRFHSKIRLGDLDISRIDVKTAGYLNDMYQHHCFDLLGSGWVRNMHNMDVCGLEGYRYEDKLKGRQPLGMLRRIQRSTASEILSIVGPDYVYIDWQRDVKSGYRWSERDWYKRRRRLPPGSDLKVPWELGRFHHLPQMAVFARVISEKRNALLFEFRNQVLDFIAFNPPRFGVNWQCAMDCAIRAANWLVAYDLFSQQDPDGVLDERFSRLFFCSIHDHGAHIISNLEISPRGNRNHYLADIAGIIFIAAYMEGMEKTGQWMDFGINEIKKELLSQFYPDGVNIEASTCYHRLSLDFVVYSTAIVQGCRKNMFPGEYADRLENALEFARIVLKENGEVPQIGDNDNGRFFKFTPVGTFLNVLEAVKKYRNLEKYSQASGVYWDENVLDGRSLAAAGSGLFFGLNGAAPEFALENSLIRSLCGSNLLEVERLSGKGDFQPDGNTIKFKSRVYVNVKEFIHENTGKGSLLDEIEHYAYPDGGIYIIKSKVLYLIISAGKVGPDGIGGHAHNDKLSFEMMIGGESRVVDPGTYLYTPFPEIRNKFRSSRLHSTICFEGVEQNAVLDSGHRLPPLLERSQCWCQEFGPGKYAFGLEMGGAHATRKFIVKKDRVRIIDRADKPFTSCWNCLRVYSNGYGKLLNLSMSSC